MMRATPHPPHLTVRPRFEPNRLAPAYLVTAYEHVAPIPRRRREVGPRAFPGCGAQGAKREKEAA
jgi:hypothetical protein